MQKNNKRILLLSMLSAVSFSAVAAPIASHVVITPQCLLKQLHTTYTTLASTSSYALIEVNNESIDALIEAKHLRRATPCGGFMDVTEDWNAYKAKNIKGTNISKSFLINQTTPVKKQKSKVTANYKIQYSEQVNKLIAKIDKDAMWSDLTTLTNFPDRYSNSDNGVKASEWLKNEIQKLAIKTGHDDVTVYSVPTSGYKQASVVAKIGNSNLPGIVIGGHMDTLNSTRELKPGADDDGSGTVTVLGIARTLLESGMHFKKPIYVVWYAAEEVGLVGSSYVVKDFKKQNIPVDAVIQFDMTGYAYKNDPTIYLITDNVNKDLTAYLETLIKTYVKQPVARTQCGYSCSDHASWDRAGFTASFPFEASFGSDNPTIHTSKDKMDILSLNHIHDFAKLGTAFAVELAEPTA